MNPPQPTVGYDPGAVTTTPPGSAPPYDPLPPGQAAPGYPTPAGTAYQPASPGAATQPTQPQPTTQAQPAPPPARNLRQLFQKVGGHAKQTAKDVAGQTMDYTADAANSVIDNTLTSSSDVVKSNVLSTAGGLGGVGQALFNGAKGKQDPKDLAAALASGRAVLRQLRFQEHTATLDPSNGPVLAQLGQALLATPGQYLIEGHVDKTEGNQAQALSEQRAAAVKNALVSSGVSPMQLVAAGYGATRPLSGGSSARIEIARTQ
jgi:outer membrane protein OmpA-like peptidoglycan-associated protein